MQGVTLLMSANVEYSKSKKNKIKMYVGPVIFQFSSKIILRTEKNQFSPFSPQIISFDSIFHSKTITSKSCENEPKIG